MAKKRSRKVSAFKKGVDFSDPVTKVMFAGGIVLFMFAFGIFGYRIIGEGEWSYLDCAYMTVITLTTVGYGEVINVQGHLGGTIFTMILILLGMGTILFFISTLTAFIVEGQLRDLLWRKKMGKVLKNLSNHVIICGLGETGVHVAEEMIATDTPFVMVDMDEDRLKRAEELLNIDAPYVVGDASDDDVLKEAGVDKARGLIAACTEDKDNVFIIVSAKNLNSGLRVVSKAISLHAERKLRRAGADKVVTTNFIGGLRLAGEMLHPTLTKFLDRMSREEEQSIRLDEVKVRSDSPFIGKSLMTLDIRRMLNLTVLAIENRANRKYIFNPESDFVLDAGMTLICMGEIQHIERLRVMAKS